MTTLQFAVFFAALLVGYVLVHVRLVRFETYLREVSALKVMNERLKGLSDVLTRVRNGVTSAWDIRASGRLEVIHSGPGGMLGETTGAEIVPPPQRLLLSPIELTERRRPLNTSRSKIPTRPWLAVMIRSACCWPGR